jgi:hypothetical protein
MRDPALRNKITWYSFFFSLLVVWIHAYNAELFLGSGVQTSFPAMVERFLGEGIGQIAVPGFFMISGYLFFYDFEWEKLGGKWNRRIYSVLVPYIMWNALYYAGYVIGSRLPWMSRVVGKGIIQVSLSELTAAILFYKYNPVFWYMYQLIFLILLAPLLYVALKQTWSAVIWFAVLACMLVTGAELPVINVDALVYYSVAAEAALIHQKIRKLEEREQNCGSKPAGGNALCVTGAALLALAAGSYAGAMVLAAPVLLVLCRLLAVGGLWLLIPAGFFPEGGEMVRHNFFLYATHFAFVRLINKTAAIFLPHHPAIPLILYLLMPLLVLGISSAGSYILNKFMPGLGRLLNGGR